MKTDNPIIDLEQAKAYFVSMGCSSFHMARESSLKYEEYNALEIERTIESEWIKEVFEKKLDKFNTISPNDYGWQLSNLSSLIDRKEFHLEKLLELVLKIQDKLPNDQLGLVLSTIIGNNGTKSKGGLIQESFDMNRIDLAHKFYVQSKFFLKKAEDNLITITSVCGYLIDVIEYYELEENKEFLISLQNKYYIESFKDFKKGAEEGKIFYMKMLSDCYREGKGCSIDIVKAEYWKQKGSI